MGSWRRATVEMDISRRSWHPPHQRLATRVRGRGATMRSEGRQRATRPMEVPRADAALRESAARVTALNRGLWGHVLARLRMSAGHSLAEQAAALGGTESSLFFTHTVKDKEFKNEGKYTLDGDKLT